MRARRVLRSKSINIEETARVQERDEETSVVLTRSTPEGSADLPAKPVLDLERGRPPATRPVEGLGGALFAGSAKRKP